MSELLHLLRRRVWLAAALAALAVYLCFLWLNAPASGTLAPPESSRTAVAAPPPARMLVVDVVGAVRSPGVVELPAGSRVRDAVAAAGGLRKGAVAGVNLARPLVDGEQVVVGQPPEGAADGKVNLNTATATDLEDLPGVGPVLAARIIAHRDEHGPFQSVAALDAVSGVGPTLMAQLRDLVSVG